MIDQVETVQCLGFAWVRPPGNAVWWCDGVRYGGAVAVQTSAGDIMLARVERVSGSSYSRIRYVGIAASELPTAERMSWWSEKPEGGK